MFVAKRFSIKTDRISMSICESICKTYKACAVCCLYFVSNANFTKIEICQKKNYFISVERLEIWRKKTSTETFLANNEKLRENLGRKQLYFKRSNRGLSYMYAYDDNYYILFELARLVNRIWFSKFQIYPNGVGGI